MVRVTPEKTHEEVVSRIRALFTPAMPLPTEPDSSNPTWGYLAIGFAFSVDPPFGKRRHRRGWCAL